MFAITVLAGDVTLDNIVDGDPNGDNVIDQDDLDIAYALFGLEITAVG